VGVHPASRPDLRRGSESRRTVAESDEVGLRAIDCRQAAQHALLRRPSAGRAHDHRRNIETGGQMSTTTTMPPPKKVNRIGLEILNYKGSKTTLCAGCGHNSISERIVEC